MLGLREIVNKARNGNLGFCMDEVMSGDHAFEPGFGDTNQRLAMEFRVTWGPKNLWDWLDPRSDNFLWQELSGTVSIAGLCEEASCQGILELRYFEDHILRYDFEFEVDGTAYRFVGEKVNVWPWNLPVSHTTCYGVLTEKESGRLVSKSVTHFRAKTIPAFLASLRLC